MRAATAATAVASRRRRGPGRRLARRRTSPQSPGSPNAGTWRSSSSSINRTSSSALPQRLSRGGERGADRARADRERGGNRGIVEVGVVVEKDDSRCRSVRRSSGRTAACPFEDASTGSASAGRLRRASRAALTTIRQTHASRVPLPRKLRRLRTALANPSCTASQPSSRSPAIAAATRRNSGRRER